MNAERTFFALFLLLNSSESMAQQGSPAAGFTRANVEGVELEYRVTGTGEPVILVHAGILADWWEPLIAQPALTSRYRIPASDRQTRARSVASSSSDGTFAVRPGPAIFRSDPSIASICRNGKRSHANECHYR
jgi:hypothetical protein